VDSKVFDQVYLRVTISYTSMEAANRAIKFGNGQLFLGSILRVQKHSS